MDYLARREHSFFELSQKLSLKFPEAEASLIDQALSGLQADGLQSDTRFTESYIRYRKSRGFGYLHIRADLLSRGISETLLNDYLFIDDDDWRVIIDSRICKKIGEDEALSFGSSQHRKLVRFLESRGFTSLEIRRALESRLEQFKMR